MRSPVVRRRALLGTGGGVLLAGALLAGLLAAGGCGERRPGTGPRPDPDLPRAGELNAHVLAVRATYPTDGTHRYHWPRTGAWRGVTRTLTYDGAVLFEGDPEGRCHCSGLTFEVFLTAWLRWAREHGRPERLHGRSAEQVRELQQRWFGEGGDRQTLRRALVEGGLGVDVPLEQAQAGDFVQLWRWSGSGHSAVLLAVERAPDGSPAALRYWSTQASTNGIGERREPFGTTGSAIDRSQTWVVRPGR